MVHSTRNDVKTKRPPIILNKIVFNLLDRDQTIFKSTKVYLYNCIDIIIWWNNKHKNQITNKKFLINSLKKNKLRSPLTRKLIYSITYDFFRSNSVGSYLHFFRWNLIAETWLRINNWRHSSCCSRVVEAMHSSFVFVADLAMRPHQ